MLGRNVPANRLPGGDSCRPGQERCPGGSPVGARRPRRASEAVTGAGVCRGLPRRCEKPPGSEGPGDAGVLVGGSGVFGVMLGVSRVQAGRGA